MVSKLAQEYVDKHYPSFTIWNKQVNGTRHLNRVDNLSPKTYYSRQIRNQIKKAFIEGYKTNKK